MDQLADLVPVDLRRRQPAGPSRTQPPRARYGAGENRGSSSNAASSSRSALTVRLPPDAREAEDLLAHAEVDVGAPRHLLGGLRERESRSCASARVRSPVASRSTPSAIAHVLAHLRSNDQRPTTRTGRSTGPLAQNTGVLLHVQPGSTSIDSTRSRTVSSATRPRGGPARRRGTRAHRRRTRRARASCGRSRMNSSASAMDRVVAVR